LRHFRAGLEKSKALIIASADGINPAALKATKAACGPPFLLRNC